MGSAPGTLSTTDLVKIGMGAAIAVAGFLAAYVSNDILPQIDQSNTSGMIAVAAFSVLANLLRKFATYTKP